MCPPCFGDNHISFEFLYSIFPSGISFPLCHLPIIKIALCEIYMCISALCVVCDKLDR